MRGTPWRLPYWPWESRPIDSPPSRSSLVSWSESNESATAQRAPPGQLFGRSGRPARTRPTMPRQRSSGHCQGGWVFMVLTPCEGGREPKASGGFGSRKGKPPARKNRSLPPSQGGRVACSFLVDPTGKIVDESGFLRDKLRELRRRHAHALEALRVELLAYLGVGERLHDLGMDARDDLGRRARRQPEAEPVDEVVVLEARFLHRRHVGQALPALRPGERQHAHLARLHLRRRDLGADEEEIDAAGDEVAHRLGYPLVRDEGDVGAAHRLHHLGRNVARGA